MYLGDSINLGRKAYRMAGILPVKFCLEKKPQAHGYTVVEISRKNPFYKKGTTLKGHEFHYSKAFYTGRSKEVFFAFRMKRGQGIVNGMDGICYKNLLAAYTHLHATGTPEWADGFIKKALIYSKRKS